MTTLSQKSLELQSDRGEPPCVRPLASYLEAVCRELANHRMSTHNTRVQAPGPQQALCASFELTRPGSPRRVLAGWHEEFGWWVAPRGQTDRRYLTGSLAPRPEVVANFLAFGAEQGSTAAVPHRYRLLAGGRDLVALLSDRPGDDHV